MSRFFKTRHEILWGDARHMPSIRESSIALVVTSPPYPMIGMWDECFSGMDAAIAQALQEEKGKQAFDLMHRELDKVWEQLARLVIPGGIVCINIGDATRTIQKHFKLYSNHSRIISAMEDLGFSNLPNILWRKPTNAPNKFMGSGMLAPGAYVTLEHEYILIFRKGEKRAFTTESEKERRRESAYFWEERNEWFSDLWQLTGVRQSLGGGEVRSRSGAYPLELAYRLIQMFSLKEDRVLDPFAGTGTTLAAAAACGRNSIHVELERDLGPVIAGMMAPTTIEKLNRIPQGRLERHRAFVKKRLEEKGENAFKYQNAIYNFPVLTAQEKALRFEEIIQVMEMEDFCWELTHRLP